MNITNTKQAAWGNAFVIHSGLSIKQVLTVNAWLPSVLQWQVTNTPSNDMPAQVPTNAGCLTPALVPSPLHTDKLKSPNAGSLYCLS